MVGAVLSVALAALAAAGPLHAIDLEEAPGWRPEPFPVCVEQPCRFEGRSGRDLYLVDRGRLTRTGDGERLYERELAENHEEVILAGISPATNQLVIAFARQRVSVRGRSALSTGVGRPHPKDVEREHRLAVINPKSGESIKDIDLGPFLPRDLAITEHGDHVSLVGDELHLSRRELRIYNTRSGKLEIQEMLPSRERVLLASEGVVLEDRALRLVAGDAGEVRRFNSRDPYSIAEYLVECASPLDRDDLADRSLAVVAFDGADGEVNRMLTSALSLELQGGGFRVAERERIETILDELWLQTTGATEAETAVRLGKLANVHHLIFGSLREAGTTSSLAVRAVSVEQGELAAGCEVVCRDCRRDDYLEALKLLAAVWMGQEEPR